MFRVFDQDLFGGPDFFCKKTLSATTEVFSFLYIKKQTGHFLTIIIVYRDA